MKAIVYNTEGKSVGEMDLPENIFGQKWNPDLVHQVFLAQTNNRRKPIAHTKDRSAVRGGGKKPWKQKHTGRARHGSTRSPLWVGGGVTHGPTKERRYDQKVNKKMARAAIYSVLSKKLSDDEIRIVDSLNLTSHKTKDLFSKLKAIVKSSRLSALIIPCEQFNLATRASRNIPKVRSLSANNLNVTDLLQYKNVVLEKKTVELFH